MKIIIASDIHGSAKWCGELLRAVKEENADKMFLLGDILYHGPRNPLPDDYNPMKVVEMLESVKEKIICVRGNCDSEVDQMVLPFPVTSDYASAFIDGIKMYLSHGHREVPPLVKTDVYLTGHTHVPLKEICDYIHLNPGSVSLPKEGSGHGYILYENRTFYFKTFEKNVYDELKV